MKKLKLITLTAFSAFALYACNNAGNKDTVETADSINDSMDTTTMRTDNISGVADFDADFAVHAANDGMAEVSLGSLAQQKATNPEVKAFAADMVKDHTEANNKLTGIATQKNITLPAAPGDEKQEVAKELSQKMGTEFDKAYVDQMVEAHNNAVSLFEDAAKNAVDPDLKAFAANTLPTLKAHQARIKLLQDKM